MVKLRIVADYGDLCGECPVWDEDDACLYWTDIAGLKLHRYYPTSGRHHIVKRGLEIHGFRLDKSGGFVITNKHGVWGWDGKSHPRLIVGGIDGVKCRLNDCIADPIGRLLAGSCYFAPDVEYESGKLIRVDVDGKVHTLDEGFHMANGLGFSPDSRTLYFTDSAARRIFAYDYNQTTGEVSNRRTLVEIPPDEGLPDGLAVDSKGFIWSAQWYGSCVVRYDPTGAVERVIRVPAKQPTSVAFGGRELTDIYITSAGESGPLPIMPPGYNPHSGYFGGALYHLNLGIQGMRQFRTDILGRLQESTPRV